MTVEERARQILENSGRKQNWVADQMNKLDPTLGMTPAKISATMTGHREMSVPEFLAFCEVTGTEPNDFRVSPAC